MNEPVPPQPGLPPPKFGVGRRVRIRDGRGAADKTGYVYTVRRSDWQTPESEAGKPQCWHYVVVVDQWPGFSHAYPEECLELINDRGPAEEGGDPC